MVEDEASFTLHTTMVEDVASFTLQIIMLMDRASVTLQASMVEDVATVLLLIQPTRSVGTAREVLASTTRHETQDPSIIDRQITMYTPLPLLSVWRQSGEDNTVPRLGSQQFRKLWANGHS